jgi:hypothetical protein
LKVRLNGSFTWGKTSFDLHGFCVYLSFAYDIRIHIKSSKP